MSELELFLIAFSVAAALVAAYSRLALHKSKAALMGLRGAARAIAGDDLNARAPISGPAYVADTGSALNTIAEQMRARVQSVERGEALVAGLVEALNEAVVFTDAANNVVRINSAARGLFGVDDATPFPTGKLPRTRGLQQALATAARGTVVAAFELDVRGHQVSLTARPLDGGGVVLAALDLTPLRKLEAVRRDFVANVSHELRTPLTVVRGFAETLAADDVEPAARRDFSAKIRANTERMQRIVDDLLDLSRIESGGWVPQPTLVDLRPLAEELLAPARSGARGGEIAFAAEIMPGAEAVYADRVALTQTLTNLVDNAIRHTSSGTVTIFAQPSAQGVWVGVRDTGEGIPAEHVPRIFERFYRADPGRSRQSGGTGLGLAIVKHLVEAHGGTVAADSDVGRGSAIRAFFPGPPVS